MEKKNALSNSLKDHSLSNNMMPKNPWHNNNNNNNNGGCSGHTCSSSDHQDCVRGCCSWPPRSYSCSFCKREFRSAQALGGHMNVHRRDRARLRQSPPMEFYHHHHQGQPILTLNPNPNPNPNPNYKFPPSSNSLVSTITPSRPPLVSPFSSSPASLGKKTMMSCCLRPPPVVVKSKTSSDQEMDLCRFRSSSLNNNNNSRSVTRMMRSSMAGTDLQLGDPSSSHDNHNHNYVDLELRLGR